METSKSLRHVLGSVLACGLAAGCGDDFEDAPTGTGATSSSSGGASGPGGTGGAGGTGGGGADGGRGGGEEPECGDGRREPGERCEGKLALAPKSPIAVGQRPRAVRLADLNQDGALDVVTAHDFVDAGTSSISVLLSNP